MVFRENGAIAFKNRIWIVDEYQETGFIQYSVNKIARSSISLMRAMLGATGSLPLGSNLFFSTPCYKLGPKKNAFASKA